MGRQNKNPKYYVGQIITQIGNDKDRTREVVAIYENVHDSFHGKLRRYVYKDQWGYLGSCLENHLYQWENKM